MTEYQLPAPFMELHKEIVPAVYEAWAAQMQKAYQAGEKAWKDAVIDPLVILYIYRKEHEADPRLALNDAIDYHVQIALDPQVSSDAAALVQRGRDAMLREVIKAIQGGSFLHDKSPAKLFANEVCKMLGELK
jgi:hypothetical protein